VAGELHEPERPAGGRTDGGAAGRSSYDDPGAAAIGRSRSRNAEEGEGRGETEEGRSGEREGRKRWAIVENKKGSFSLWFLRGRNETKRQPGELVTLASGDRGMDEL
jgi:hypothetical protein